nr:DUF2252 family protein [Marinibactrum halimedae]
MPKQGLRIKQLVEALVRVDGAEPALGIPKHQKMASDPFVFLRGSASLLYSDIASGLITFPDELDYLPLTTVMGDCHVANFGFITEEGSHGDRVIFAPNDFDDACIGRPVWDVFRFLVSMVLAAGYGAKQYGSQQSENEPDNDEKVSDGSINTGILSEAHIEQAMKDFLWAYRNACSQSVQDSRFYHTALASFEKPHCLAKFWKKARKRCFGEKNFMTKSALAKACDLERHPLQFRTDPAKFQRLNKTEYCHIESAFAPYVDDDILDIVERLNAGTGSVNMPRYYLLVGPRGASSATSDLLALSHLIEVKQQRHAAPLFHFQSLSPKNRLNPAHLTVYCQSRMQRSPDLVLDEVVWQGAHWLVRSRHHARVGIDPEAVTVGENAVNGGFSDYAQACGHVLALAHGRGDRRSTQLEQRVVSVLPDHIEGLVRGAFAYAEVVKQDCELLKTLLPSHRSFSSSFQHA